MKQAAIDEVTGLTQTRLISLQSSEQLRVSLSPKGDVLLEVEVTELSAINEPMALLHAGLTELGMSKSVVYTITDELYRAIDRELIGEILKKHLVTRDF